MNFRDLKLYQNLRWKVLQITNPIRKLWKLSILSLKGRFIELPFSKITDEFGFSLAPNGWNFFCSLLEDYDRNPNVSWDETTLAAFFKSQEINSAKSLNDILFFHDSQKNAQQEYHFYIGTWPWGGMTPGDSKKGGTPFGWYYDQKENKMTKELWGYGRNLWYEPRDQYTIEFEMKHTLDLYPVIKKGFNPWKYLDFPSVTLLIRKDGEKLGVIVDGHHRLSILGHLKYKKVNVIIRQIIRETEVDQWYYVKKGFCKKEQALEIFHAFFTLNGQERIQHLGLSLNK